MNLVHRETPLPKATARGQLLVAEDVLTTTTDALVASKGADGPHEGLVLWAGRQLGDIAIITTTVVPDTDHGHGHVMMDKTQVADAARAAHAHKLGIVAQVHSHPGTDVRHSDGDDQLILMRYEGMFSLVVASYGTTGFTRVGVHQYQDGSWCQITNAPDAITVVPGVLR